MNNLKCEIYHGGKNQKIWGGVEFNLKKNLEPHTNTKSPSKSLRFTKLNYKIYTLKKNIIPKILRDYNMDKSGSFHLAVQVKMEILILNRIEFFRSSHITFHSDQIFYLCFNILFSEHSNLILTFFPHIFLFIKKNFNVF